LADICVSLSTVNSGEPAPPKFTAVAPVNPVPVIVIVLPPAAGPLAGLINVIVGVAKSSLRMEIVARGPTLAFTTFLSSTWKVSSSSISVSPIISTVYARFGSPALIGRANNCGAL
jgi:hypothetical protein